MKITMEHKYACLIVFMYNSSSSTFTWTCYCMLLQHYPFQKGNHSFVYRNDGFVHSDVALLESSMGLSQFPITTSVLGLHSKKTVFQRMTDVHAQLLCFFFFVVVVVVVGFQAWKNSWPSATPARSWVFASSSRCERSLVWMCEKWHKTVIDWVVKTPPRITLGRTGWIYPPTHDEGATTRMITFFSRESL